MRAEKFNIINFVFFYFIITFKLDFYSYHLMHPLKSFQKYHFLKTGLIAILFIYNLHVFTRFHL